MLRQLSITLIYIPLPVTCTCLLRVHQLSAQEHPVQQLELEICPMIETDSGKEKVLLK